MPLVDLDVVRAAAPQYPDLTLSAIVRELGSPDMQARMLQGLSKSRFTVAADLLTANIDSSALPPSAIPPTLMLSLESDQNIVQGLLPCHDLTLISFCSTLPVLPSSSCSTSIPVVPLRLPSPQTFHIIRDYIYTRSKPALMSSLLALSNSKRLEVTTITGLSTSKLAERVRTVYGVFSNACRVGFGDDEFWRCLQAAWKLLLTALAAQPKRLEALPL